MTSTNTASIAIPRVPPAALWVGAGAFQWWASLSRRPSVAPTAAAMPAAAIAASSVAIVVSSVEAFRVRHTTLDPRDGAAPSALVTDGLNAFSRNPMYVGMAGTLLAGALASGRARAVLPLGLFVAWIDRVQIPAEESDLRRVFGEAYEAYSVRVPRWLGRPTARSHP